MGDEGNSAEQSCCNMGNIVGGMVAMDMFGKKAEMRLPNGSIRYNTLIGCCCTFVYMAVVVLFLLVKAREFMDQSSNLTVTNMAQDQFIDMELDPSVEIAFGIIDPLDPTFSVASALGSVVAR